MAPGVDDGHPLKHPLNASPRFSTLALAAQAREQLDIFVVQGVENSTPHLAQFLR
jgi:hypothetical protein